MANPRQALSRFKAEQPMSLAMVWLAVTFVGIVLVFVTDFPAWIIASWIAATIGSIVALEKAAKDDADNATD